MKVMNIPANILKMGMVTFEDVYNSAGVAILVKGTILDQWQVEKILINNVEKVRIELSENDGLYAVSEEIKSVYNQENIRAFKQKYENRVNEVTHIIKEISRGADVDIHSVRARQGH
jgi:hypothetical protein